MPPVLRLPLACTVGAVGVLLFGSVVVARAELEKAQETTSRVTTYLAVQYSTSRCEGDEALKVNMVSRRWHRSSLRRKVRAQYYTFGTSRRCNGDPLTLSHSSGVFRPCFGCDGNSRRWTRDYVSTYTWPYMRRCECDKEHVGALAATQVSTRRGRTLGVGCVKIPLLGHIDSPVC
jgi:hypothetical protein